MDGSFLVCMYKMNFYTKNNLPSIAFKPPQYWIGLTISHNASKIDLPLNTIGIIQHNRYQYGSYKFH